MCFQFVLSTGTGFSRYDGTTLMPLLYVLVSLISGALPACTASTRLAVTLASSRVSLNNVEYCSPRRIDLTDGISASWPLTIGQGCCGVQYPTPFSDDRIPMDRPS